MNIVVEKVQKRPIEQQRVEIVERKGVGHPDSLADGIAESVSRALSIEYIKRFGRILHHNTDQCEVISGGSEVTFGGGQILRPIFILIAGQATDRVGDEEIATNEIAVRAAEQYLKSNMPHLDVDTDVTIDSRVSPGALSISHIFETKEKVILANDTSFGVGFAPLSELENLVLNMERFLNSKKTKTEFPELGEDIKVMGLRSNSKISLTIAAPFIAKKVPNWSYYISKKSEIIDKIKDFVASKRVSRETKIYLNTNDDEKKKIAYLTLTGTSAEAGDSGSVGRGNRVNGLITPNREMSLEAAAGKNPVNHIGKIYNLLAKEIAEKIHEETGAEIYVKLLSQIGKPITEPLVAGVEIINGNVDASSVESITQEQFMNINKIRERLLKNELHVF